MQNLHAARSSETESTPVLEPDDLEAISIAILALQDHQEHRREISQFLLFATKTGVL
jgi:hypothetical protein|tara:strand:+ start:128 stop:298 length:171 start_codon:yes stop_codon:yes gene_type:complete